MVSCRSPAFLALALLTPASSAQFEPPPSISHTSWTTSDGLPQDSVLGISQDSIGYLWVTTFGGLARFDGRHFDVFSVLNRSDLPGSRFLRVFHTLDSSLWLWIQDFGMYRYRGDRFEHFETPPLLRQLDEDAEGNLWVIFGPGLVRIREDRVESVMAGAFQSVRVAEDGVVWVSAFDGELLRFEGGRATRFGEEAGLPRGEPMVGLAFDADGVLWGGSRVGVWRSTDSTKTAFEKVDGAPEQVGCVAVDGRGALWFGCRDRLVRWDPVANSGTTIAEGDFATLFEDVRGNLWAGTRGQGLHCFRYAALHDANAPLGIPADDTWAVTQAPEGTVYVLLDRTLLEVRDGRSEATSFDDNLRSLLVDRAGNLWIGMSGGLVRRSGDREVELGEDEGLFGAVRALLEDREGRLWVGTARGLFVNDGDRFVQHWSDRLSGVRCLHENAATGTLWVGAQTGLARIDGASFVWLCAENGLSPGSIRALHLDEDGVLWVGSYGGGLNRIENGEITRYSSVDGLADDFLSCILEDDDDRLWINSNRGPFVVHRSELNRFAKGEADRVFCTTFTRGEGAREANGGSQPVGWRAADGRMWFPSIEGVTIADPRELPLDEAPPNAVIESVEIGANRSVLVRFAALGFSSPERVRVQTRLIGHAEDWMDDLGEREVRYSYLPPGSYQFQLRARNGYGPWSPVVGESFEIEPRFHETTAFLVAIALLGALGSLILTEFRMRRSRARTAELVNLVAERERAERSLSRSRAELRRLSQVLLSNQETERQRLSRELHDDLSQRLAALAIQAQVVRRRLGSADERTSAQLNDLVEMSRQLAIDVQQLSHRLHPVGLRSLGLAEAARQECEAFARRSGVEIELDVNVALDEVPEEVAVAAFRILQESLHNVEKHARASAVEIRIVVEGGELLVSAADHGRGFDPESGSEAGLGLVTMRERATSISGRLTVTSRPGVGTTVCLRVPLRRSPR